MSLRLPPPRLRVRRSPIHGRGLFTLDLIYPGRIIGKFEGEMVTEETVSPQDHPHVLWDFHEWGDEGLLIRNNLRFINHSRGSNVYFHKDNTVRATKKIRPGQELTGFYNF